LYDEAMAQEKSESPTTTIFKSPNTAPAQQVWNTIGGKPAQKANPWGSQANRKFPWYSWFPAHLRLLAILLFELQLTTGHLTPRGVTFQSALKANMDEQTHPAKGG
jgi:hypothetical protein